MKNSSILVTVVSIAFTLNVQAQSAFTDIVQSLTGDRQNVILQAPDLDLFKAATTIEQTNALARGQSYPRMLKQQKTVETITNSSILSQIQKNVRTIVIVPGLFSEFIKTRAFEEIFARSSSYQKVWSQNSLARSIYDSRYDLKTGKTLTVPLADVIDAASLDDHQGRPLVKIVLLKMNTGSLESVGDVTEKAALLARRLQKYYEITHDENIVLLGYSRGGPLSLEMVTQGEAQKLSFVSHVSELVTLSGVIMGSTVADKAEDINSDSGRIFAAAKKLSESLQTTVSYLDMPIHFYNNTQAVANFLIEIQPKTKTPFNPSALIDTTTKGDFTDMGGIIKQMTSGLSINSFMDFNSNVMTSKKLIDELLKAVDGLKTSTRVAWWRSHTLPKHIKYLSISAVMADPDKSAEEKAIYDAHVGYNNTLDDATMQSGRRDYEKTAGATLNDSQVGLHQSMFLPNLIKTLNPENGDLKMDVLGVVETHHWGVALQTVNGMKDGRLNPFPREKILLSLAAYLNQ